MAGAVKRTFDERDYLNVGGEYQSRRPALPLILDELSPLFGPGEESPLPSETFALMESEGFPETEGMTQPERAEFYRGVLSGEIGPGTGARPGKRYRYPGSQRLEEFETQAGKRFKAPLRPTSPIAGAVRTEEARSGIKVVGERGSVKAPASTGLFSWEETVDGRKIRHITDKPETVPAGVEPIPVEAPDIEGPGGRFYGDFGAVRGAPREGVSAEEAGREFVARGLESDEQRESRLIREIAAEKGVDLAEAGEAFRGARREITGEPTAARTYEENLAIRQQVQNNIQNAYDTANTPQEKNRVLAEGQRYMKLHGLTDLKKPEAVEPTIPTVIEGKTVNVPLKDWDPKKHGKAASEGAREADMPAGIRTFEAVWGFKPNQRGTEPYRKKYMELKRDASAEKMTREKWQFKIAGDMAEQDIDPRTKYFEDRMKGFLSFYDQVHGTSPAEIAGAKKGVKGKPAKERKPLSAFGG